MALDKYRRESRRKREFHTLQRKISRGELDQDVNALPLNLHAWSVLRSFGAKTIRDVTVASRKELDRLPQCGPKTLDHIESVLKALGLTLHP